MKKTFKIAIACLLSAVILPGCGDINSSLPSNYVGTFKSTRTNNGASVTVQITQDDGTTYTGMIATFPVNAQWGEAKTDALGLTTYQLVKGNDTNFLDFSLSISGSTVSGSAVRQ